MILTNYNRNNLFYNLNKFFKINPFNPPVMLMSSSKRLNERDTTGYRHLEQAPQDPQHLKNKNDPQDVFFRFNAL